MKTVRGMWGSVKSPTFVCIDRYQIGITGGMNIKKHPKYKFGCFVNPLIINVFFRGAGGSLKMKS